jgi:hypothetical protein
MELANEKRQDPRLEMDSRIDVLVSFLNVHFWCTARDLGTGGLSVYGPHPIKTGTSLRVRFRLPDDYGWVDAGVSLVRTANTAGGTIWGMAFRHMETDTSQRLDRYVKRSLRDQILERYRSKVLRLQAVD